MRNGLVTVSMQVDPEDLVESIVRDLTTVQLVDFVKKLDERAQDWDLTKDLHKYFDEEFKKYEKENEGT